MEFLTNLWLPIVLSAVFVFIASSLIHMLLKIHKNAFAKLPDEDGIQAALRGYNIAPGDYFLPCPSSTAVMKSPEFDEKVKKGPVVLMTVFPAGGFGMGKSLVLWFVNCLVVGFFSAYVAWHSLGVGAHYLLVFRIVGTTTFMGYALALLQTSIWYKRKWSTTFLLMFDGLVYGLLTAGVFGWLWPKM